MSFTYFNPVKIHFDISLEIALKTLNELQNTSILLVTSQGWGRRGVIDTIKAIVPHIKIIDCITENPELSHLQELKRNIFGSYEAIIALGGGSVLDSAKFFALQNEICAENGELRIISDESRGISALPIFAFPTTAGTGSEATKWATIWDKQSNIKYSLAHECLYPKMAFYDIDLMMSLPPQITLHTALDALSHAVESVWNKNANPISTHYAKAAIELILEHLVLLMECLERVDSEAGSKDISATPQYDKVSESNSQINATTQSSNSKILSENTSESAADFLKNHEKQPQSANSSIADEVRGLSKNCAETSLKGCRTSNSADSREIRCETNLSELKNNIRHLRKQIALANLYAALAFSNTQTALAHAISYPITMQFGLPHGLACSFSLPLLLDCIADAEADLILQPYKARIKQLFTQLQISHNPRDYGLDSQNLQEIFSSLNSRAKNGLLDIAKAQSRLSQS